MSEKKSGITGGFARERSSLLPILLKAQATESCITPEAVADISRFLDMSENDVYSVASSYKQFRLSPPGDATKK